MTVRVDTMKLDGEVRSHVYDYLLDTTDLDAFEEWFVGETWDDRTPLVVTVDHLLAERAVLSEPELHRALLDAVSTVRGDLAASAVRSAAASATLVRSITMAPEETAQSQVIRGTLEFAGT
jgi:hypothetical protein